MPTSTRDYRVEIYSGEAPTRRGFIEAKIERAINQRVAAGRAMQDLAHPLAVGLKDTVCIVVAPLAVPFDC